MVIDLNQLSAFAQFLREHYAAKPMMRAGDEDELLRAVVDSQLLIVLQLNSRRADVWCSESSQLKRISRAWNDFCELSQC